MKAIQQGGYFSELITGSCDGEADVVAKMSSRCAVGSLNLKRYNKNRVYFNKRVNNSFLANGHAKLTFSSLTEYRKRIIPVLCNQHSTEYTLDDSLSLTNGHPSESIQGDKRNLVGVLTDESHSSSARNELVRLALPAVVGQALDPFAQLLETAFIGRLGSVELAAAGVSVSVFNIISKLFNVPLLSVTTSFVAEELSKNAKKLELPSISTALLLAAVIGAVEALALFMGSGTFLNMMGISPVSPMHSPAQHFLSLRALGAPAVVVSLAIQGVFRGFKDTKTPLFCVGIGNISSIILLPLFAYSFGLGITGAATATVASQYITTLLLIWSLSKRAVVLTPRIRELQFGGYLKSGGFLLGRTLSVLITMTLGTSMAARLGPLAMAAHQICLQIWLAVSLLSDALALSAQALIASSFAKYDYKRVKEITLCVLKFVSATQPINALAFIFDGLHYGVSDFAYSAYSMMIVAMIASVFLLYAPTRFAINGVWCGLTLFMTLRMAAGFMRLCWRSGPWWFLQNNEVIYKVVDYS